MVSSFVIAVCLQLAPTNPFAGAVVRLSTKYGLDPELALAIVHQESSGRMVTTSRRGKVFDIGLMQLNEHTARAYGFNTSRLIFDPYYNLEAGLQVLADKIKQCSRKVAPWACYHSATASKRVGYMLAVARHLPPPKVIKRKLKKR